MKLCPVCGVVTSRTGSRCATHARQSNRSRHNALYSTREWQHLSARMLRAWRGQHGEWCPGYQRDAHPASDLTVDHVVPLASRWRAPRHRQLRRALPVLQLDQGCVGGRPGEPTRRCRRAGRPRPPDVRARPSFAKYPGGRRSGPGPRSPTGATVGPRAAMSERMATYATPRERAPGLRPGPNCRLGAVGLSGVALNRPPVRRSAVREGAASGSAQASPRFRLGRRHLGGRSAVGGLAGLRLAGQAGGVLVPVGLAHPAQSVLLGGLNRCALRLPVACTTRIPAGS